MFPRLKFTKRFSGSIVALGFAVLLATSINAQTTASLQIGGPGAPGCQGGNPPTLPGGVPATGTLDFAYDHSTSVLTLTVTNTSPVTPGVPNPLITTIVGNMPQLAINEMALLTQTGSGGANPNFIFEHDTSLTTPPNPITTPCFGAFGFRIRTPNGLGGGIANANANVFPGNPAAAVIGPVTFTFAVVTTSTNLGAQAFSHSLSVNPTGAQYVNAAFRFQGGGAELTGGYIGNAAGGSPAGWVVGNPVPGGTITVVQAGLPGWSGCFITSLNPGPTIIDGVSYPIGLPYVVLQSGVVPANGILSTTITIPLNLPELAVQTFYGLIALSNPQQNTVSVSEQFTLMIDFQ